jgi:threonylcarbamoyladenosine tRNA methylthiotransferase MtaB
MAELLLLNSRPRQETSERDSGPRVAFVTLGCKVNQSDTQRFIADFRGAGFRIVPPHASADVYVVNTCSVTHVADRKSRQWLRRGSRSNRDALVVATGCYAESGKDALGEMDEVGLVVGFRQKDDLLSLVLEKLPQYNLPTGAPEAAASHEERVPTWAGGGDEEGEVADFRGRTRAMVKIEDGCNDFCTFCIIPFTRGMPRSTPTEQVIEMVNARLAEGYREIVLTGVHMGKYGQDHAQRKRAASDPEEARDLPGVVEAVLSRTAVPRLRITSVEPTDALMMIPLLTDPCWHGRLAPHLHLPLQSGCDSTLARMKRDYTTAEYADVVRRVREAVPGISITTDLITGFPGETEEEWQETLRFLREMEFAKIHAFPFSRRPGTPAYTMGGQVDDAVRHARTREVIALSRELEGAYACAHLGRTLPVLWENRDDDTWSGLTGNYLRVHCRSDEDLHNRITPVTLEAYDARGLWGSR